MQQGIKNHQVTTKTALLEAVLTIVFSFAFQELLQVNSFQFGLTQYQVFNCCPSLGQHCGGSWQLHCSSLIVTVRAVSLGHSDTLHCKKEVRWRYGGWSWREAWMGKATINCLTLSYTHAPSWSLAQLYRLITIYRFINSLLRNLQ